MCPPHLWELGVIIDLPANLGGTLGGTLFRLGGIFLGFPANFWGETNNYGLRLIAVVDLC